jgi:hypothetical protein
MRSRAKLSSLLLAAAAAVAAGCAGATLDVHRPVPMGIPAVSLAVRDATGNPLPVPEVTSFRSVIASELRGSGIDVVENPGPGAARVLGTIEAYDDGNRLVRYLTPYGPGTGIVVTKWVVQDDRSRSIARCTIEGSVSTGAFGGSWQEVLEETGRALARFLKGDIQ